MARVTVEDCVDKVSNRFELVMLASHRAREISAGSAITVDRDNDKNPVVALREIADEMQSADELRERLIESQQTQIEVDEPEDDSMALLMGGEADKPAEDDMSEEKLLRALMEASPCQSPLDSDLDAEGDWMGSVVSSASPFATPARQALGALRDTQRAAAQAGAPFAEEAVRLAPLSGPFASAISEGWS